MNETLVLNMGPQHPSTHGVLRLILELDGERVVKVTPDIGFLHRGVEKLAEHRTWEQFLPFTDRLDYVSAANNNLAYVQAVEKLASLDVPPRARYLRVLLAELTRLSSHLIWLGTHAMDLGAMTLFFYTFRDREEIWEIMEMVSGARMTVSFMRIGGLRNDIPVEILGKIKAFTAAFPSRLDEYEDLLTNNPIFLRRTRGVGAIGAEEAVNLGLSGPILRASGVPFDLRRSEPYAAYADLDFEVPTGKNGDVYDRYLVRLAEMRQSLRLIDQVLERLPDGPIRTDDPRFVRPPKAALGHMEDLIRYFYLASDGSPIPAGEVYAAIESPKGELGFYLASDGTSRPARLKIRPPSFVNLSAIPRLVEGQYLADVVAVIGSIDIVLGEVDR